MNLIFHQFKTDVRLLRGWLIGLWLLQATEWVLASSSVAEFSILAIVLQVVFSAFLTARLIHADPLVDTTAFWLTRPVRRVHLFCAKAALLLLLVLLPLFLVHSLIWVRVMGSSIALWAGAFVQFLLITGAVLAGVAAAASLTKNTRQFLLFGVATFAVVLLWAGILVTLERYGFFVRRYTSSSNVAEVNRQFLMWLVLAASMGAAWVIQALRHLPKASLTIFAAGLLAGVLIANHWPDRWLLIRQPKIQQLPLKLSVLENNDPLDYEPGSQVLWSHFRVAGLGEHQLAVVGNLNANFQPPQGRPIHIAPGPMQNFGWFLQNHQAEFLKVIQSFYPTNTLWFGDLNSHHQTLLPGVGTGPVTTNAAGRIIHPSGHFSGNLGLTILDLQKIADLPLQAGTSSKFLPGERVTVRKVTPAMDGIKVNLTRTIPALPFDPKNGDFYRMDNVEHELIYVLYQPDFGEAYCVKIDYGYLGGEPIALGGDLAQMEITFPFPALRARLTGISLKDWLKGARLQFYRPAERGEFHGTFDEPNYVFQTDRAPDARKQTDASGLAAIRDATLPPHPTEAQVQAYISNIVANLPDNWDNVDWQIIDRKVNAIGVEGLPALVRMLPLNERFEASFAGPLLRKQATRELLPDLLAALPRDPALSEIFRAKGWEADARDVILKLLPEHGAPLPPDALIIAASAKDPKTYPDLARHFIYQPDYNYEVIDALRQCPGFDLTDAVRQAWKRAQLGLRADDPLCLAAAAEGLPGALDISILKLERRTQNQPLFLNQLAVLTDYKGPRPDLQTWLSQRLGQFHYDPAQKRYTTIN